MTVGHVPDPCDGYGHECGPFYGYSSGEWYHGGGHFIFGEMTSVSAPAGFTVSSLTIRTADTDNLFLSMEQVGQRDTSTWSLIVGGHELSFVDAYDYTDDNNLDGQGSHGAFWFWRNRRWQVGEQLAVSIVAPSAVPPQSGRTAPSAVDLTCHGYDEGATRAYNCIPEPSQQHHMRTFVPPVGSACDAGSIAEFPPGRIVFQIRCRDGSRGQTEAWSHWGRGPASFDMPEDASGRFWVHTAFSGSSAHFVVQCRAPQQRVVVNELLGTSWGNTGTNGIYGIAGCREVEVDTWEQDLQWWFTQELAATASMPPQSWEQVTGAGGALPAQALQDLAAAVDLERLWGPQATWGIDLGSANDRAALRTSDVVAGSGLIRIASRSADDRTYYALDRPPVRSATTRTQPLTLDLTCHGYVEPAGTRAYNCIPEPSQQHHMRTFVPPVGSACDAGSIAEFPPGRIVFQIRCRDGDATPEKPTIEYRVVEGVCVPRGTFSVFLVNPNTNRSVRVTVEMSAYYRGLLINRQNEVHNVPAGGRENIGCERWRDTRYEYRVVGWN